MKIYKYFLIEEIYFLLNKKKVLNLKIIKCKEDLDDNDNYNKIQTFDHFLYFIKIKELNISFLIFYNKIKTKNNKNIIKRININLIEDNLVKLLNKKNFDEIDLFSEDDNIFLVYENLNQYRLNQINKIYYLKDKDENFDFEEISQIKKKYFKINLFLVIFSLTSEVIYNIQDFKLIK